MPTPALPPLAFTPLPVDRPWGGAAAHALFEAGREPIAGGRPIGEWWLLSARPDRASIVRGGPFAGSSLVDLIETRAEQVLGRRTAEAWTRRFPLLLKLLDTASPLSVQVHPSDAEIESKSETWYVLAASADACFWLGLRPGRTPEEVIERARRGESPVELLERHAARPGLVAHLPAGTIHALGAGVVALEFQTNSDTTFRIWDWGRTPARKLHLDDALRAARRDQRPQTALPPSGDERSPPSDRLAACDSYRVDRLRLAGPAHLATDGESFEALLPIGAPIRVAGPCGAAEVPRGHAVLVPAETADYVVTPDAPVELFRFVPNIRGAAPRVGVSG